MSNRFSFSPSPGDDEGWFRIGSLEVTTTWLVTLTCIVSFFVFAISPRLLEPLVMAPEAVFSGQVWRVVTWPFVSYPDLFTALAIFIFWYFGMFVERELGRRRFARFLLWLTVALSALALVLALSFQSPQPVLMGIGAIELILVLLFIAENPHARFFFGIPGWVIAAVLVVLPVLAMTGGRQWLALVHFVLGLGVAAVVARSFGMLEEYEYVPAVRRPHRRERTSRDRSRSRRAHPSSRGATVTEGPWAGSSSRSGSDQARLDELLDKIHEHGMDSLTSKERNELTELSRRLRGN